MVITHRNTSDIYQHINILTTGKGVLNKKKSYIQFTC